MGRKRKTPRADRPAAPPDLAPLPPWARDPAPSSSLAEAYALAGAALAILDPLARSLHPVTILWRQRLALKTAAALARQGGRTEDEAALRDHLYFTRPGDDVGPAGRLLRAFRDLGGRGALDRELWQDRLSLLFEPIGDEELSGLVLLAGRRADGEGNAIGAAVEIAGYAARRDLRAPALWLADAVLARRLAWPAPVPLLGLAFKRGDPAAFADGEGKRVALAYARSAAAALDLYGEIARRATKLLAAAPKLRGKAADRVIHSLLEEDALTVRTGVEKPRRSRYRLFNRLVELEAARELTGRSTSRLYGL